SVQQGQQQYAANRAEPAVADHPETEAHMLFRFVVGTTAAGPGDILQAEPVSFMGRLLGVIEKATDGTAKQCDEESEYDQHESFLFNPYKQRATPRFIQPSGLQAQTLQSVIL